MVLRVPLDLFSVGIHKGLGVTQVSTEKRFELVLHDRDRDVGVISPIVLLPAETNLVPEERRGKGNPGKPRGSYDNKVVLILLTEVVTVHVKLFVVYVRGMGLQLLPGHLRDDESWDGSGSGRGNGSLSL